MTRKAKILIVDDEPGVLATLKDLVRSFGYEALGAGDAETALALLHGGLTVDLVITDLGLPGMDGVGLLKEVKRAVPSVPVIMLTGRGSVETFLRTQSGGVFEYIDKPVRAAELRRILQAAIVPPEMPTDALSAEA